MTASRFRGERRLGVVGQAITLPSGARLTVNADGSYAYDANGAFTSLAAGTPEATASPTRSRDSAGATTTATVTLTITGVNDAPIANADALTVTANAKLTGNASGVLANDRDPDTGDTLRVASVNGRPTRSAVRSPCRRALC